MRADIGVSYLRLSNEDLKAGESESITNQRRLINDYCERNNITLIGEYVDDGWSGGNFERPKFQEMMREIQKGKISLVVTKDLSRLGRDMREASYYAEQFFPENGIRYIAINDNFDSFEDNVLAPFQFAMNEVYLRDGSKKVKEVLKNKRENGLYCACPPYGYKKTQNNKNLLIPDENTAPIVQRIYERAAEGQSSRQIARDLNSDGIIPPLKYRVLYRDNFNERGAARASDYWNNTTVKRILKNEVYLGHTILGRSRKPSLKSKKKLAVPKEDWSVTRNTHQPLISEEIFSKAQLGLGRNTKQAKPGSDVRKSIFSGIVFCGKCGYAMSSCGSVYNGERYQYWYLSCGHKRPYDLHHCSGVRIRYEDLMELVRRDLNAFISMSDDEINEVVDALVKAKQDEMFSSKHMNSIERAEQRMAVIDKTISKLYLDNAEDKISDERLKIMVDDLEKEYNTLKKKLSDAKEANKKIVQCRTDAERFFELVKGYTNIDVLTRDILLTFVDRIEVGEKVLPSGVIRDTHRKHPFKQEIKIYYKFINNKLCENTFQFPLNKAL
mgnify:CR=1 FL=1|nr:MAG TPA: integrase [Caudoviricetes sp.]